MAIPQTSEAPQSQAFLITREPRSSFVQQIVSWFKWALQLLLIPMLWTKAGAKMLASITSKVFCKLNNLSGSLSLLITAWAVLSISHVLWDACLLVPVLHKVQLLAKGETHEGVVFGVVSGRDHFMQRLAVRNTWASDLSQTSLPSRIVFVVGQEDCHIHPKLRIPSHSCLSAWKRGTYAAKWNSSSFPVSSVQEVKAASLITGLSFVALTDIYIASILVQYFYSVTVHFESGKAEFSGETVNQMNGFSYVEVKINRFVPAKEVVKISVQKIFEQPFLTSPDEECQWSNGSSSVKYDTIMLLDGSTLPWTNGLCLPFTIKFENGKAQCPPEWELHNGNCYHFSTKLLSWYTAVNSCKELDATLTSIGDQEENEFIAKKMKHNFDHVWIGLSASASSETFHWIDGSTSSYQNWADYEPNYTLGRERCVLLGPNNGRWDDHPCSSPEMYVCKKPRVSAGDLKREFSEEAEQQLQHQWHERREIIRGQVAEEQRLYGDLLVVPGLTDSRHSLPHKLLALLQWTSTEHPGHWLFKTDDDTLVNVRRVMGFLRDRDSWLPSLKNCGIAVSHFKELLPLSSNASAGQQQRSWADFSPLIPFSAGYLLSDEVVSGLAAVAPQLRTYDSEAVSLGVWLSARTFPCSASPAAFWDTVLDSALRSSLSAVNGLTSVLEDFFLAKIPVSKAALMDSTSASLRPPLLTAAPAALISQPCWHRTQGEHCLDNFVVAGDLSLDEIDKIYKTYLR